MAPKRTNKRARGVGSSANHQNLEEDANMGYTGFRGNKFTTPEAKEEFDRLMTKSVAKERGFLPTTGCGEIQDMIFEKGWGIICAVPSPVPLSIVREFYANAKANKNGFSVVRGRTVDYTPRAIQRILMQPRKPAGAEEWVLKTREDVDLDHIVATICVPGTQWKCKVGTTEQVSFPASTMNRYARAWNLFICANLLPSSHTGDITVERAILLWGILNGKYIDLSYVLHQNMNRFMLGTTTGAMPHGSIVAKLCSAVGVVWAPDEPVQVPGATIDRKTLDRMEEWSGGVPHPRGLGYIITGEGGSSQSRPPHASRPVRQPRVQRQSRDQHMGAPSGLADTHYRRLLRRFDVSHDINRRFAEDLTHALDGIYQQQGIQVTWPIYGAHTIYPPPDTPPEEGDDADE